MVKSEISPAETVTATTLGLNVNAFAGVTNQAASEMVGAAVGLTTTRRNSRTRSKFTQQRALDLLTDLSGQSPTLGAPLLINRLQPPTLLTPSLTAEDPVMTAVFKNKN